ncbi:membrane protein [Ectobacillus panaciterrae]|uniref:membrane protein n=1 Tax=Ectobacillus panaciterrae TaxID=363872 RepID=UPI0003F4C054|nr:membrane protein [Ectobacillus panaciterrae]
MKETSYEHYITAGIKLGVGYGVVTLLARWITGNTILSSPETLMKYGLIGGIGYSLMGAISFGLFGLLVKHIRTQFPNFHTIGDILRIKLSKSGYWYMMFILMLTGFDSLFVQAMGAGLLLHLVFPMPVQYGLFLFFAYCFIFAGLGGMKKIQQLAAFKVILIFATVIILPVYFFIQEGVYPIYEGINLYHPYLLYLKNYDSLWFIATAVLVGTGQVMTDRSTWQRLSMLHPRKISLTFMLTGLIWTTIPLAVSSLLMTAIFNHGYKDTFTLLSQLIEKIHPLLLIALFIVCCLVAISFTVGTELHATTVLFVRNILSEWKSLSDSDQFKRSYILSGFICIVLFIVVSILSPSLLELLFFFGQIYASIVVPMAIIILRTKPIPPFLPFCSAAGWIMSTITSYYIGSLASIWISFLLSAALSFLYLLLFVRKQKPVS